MVVCAEYGMKYALCEPFYYWHLKQCEVKRSNDGASAIQAFTIGLRCTKIQLTLIIFCDMAAQKGLFFKWTLEVSGSGNNLNGSLRKNQRQRYVKGLRVKEEIWEVLLYQCFHRLNHCGDRRMATMRENHFIILSALTKNTGFSCKIKNSAECRGIIDTHELFCRRQIKYLSARKKSTSAR